MNLGTMEVLSPANYLSTASWLIDESKSTKWTHAENKAFEKALAIYDQNTPDRWLKVAAAIPGKTVGDVIRQYKELEDDVSYIEAGLVDEDADPSCYSYCSSINNSNGSSGGFTLEWVNGSGNNGYDGYGYKQGNKRRSADQERKKGVPWTEEEHKLFLMGLKKYGKGDWRNISRNFVVTRTPTQVASHAQKYFIRQLSGGKDKRRASIHDITTSTIDTLPSTIPSPPENKALVNDSPDNHSSTANHHQQPSRHQMNPNLGVSTSPSFQWGQQGMNNSFSSMRGGNNAFMLPNYGVTPYAVKIQGQNGHHQNMFLQMQTPLQHFTHG